MSPSFMGRPSFLTAECPYPECSCAGPDSMATDGIKPLHRRPAALAAGTRMFSARAVILAFSAQLSYLYTIDRIRE